MLFAIFDVCRQLLNVIISELIILFYTWVASCHRTVSIPSNMFMGTVPRPGDNSEMLNIEASGVRCQHFLVLQETMFHEVRGLVDQACQPGGSGIIFT
jgi:hypothetical protein